MTKRIENLLDKLTNKNLQVTKIDESVDDCDAIVELKGGRYIQVGDGYYMLWRIEGTSHVLEGEFSSQTKLIQAVA